jgi:hypothetical protein
MSLITPNFRSNLDLFNDENNASTIAIAGTTTINHCLDQMNFYTALAAAE